MNNNKSKKIVGSEKLTRKKNKICKNNKCVDKRTINDVFDKHITKKPDYYSNTMRYNKYLFFNLEDKQFYDTNKLLHYEDIKHKKGILMELSFSYEIEIDENDKKKKIHTFRFDPTMYFTKYTKEDIDRDPESLDASGITLERPYSFSSLSKQMFPKQIEPLVVESTIIKSDKNTFLQFINDIILEMKSNSELIENMTTIENETYQDTYKRLLYRFYTQCTTSNTNIFKIQYFA